MTHHRTSSTWRDSGAKQERGLCAYTEWGSWSGDLYVCRERAGKHDHPPRVLHRATLDENRRVMAQKAAQGEVSPDA